MSAPEPSSPGPNASHDRSLAHAQSAYANAQDIIKFLDTKTSVLTGLITLGTGLPILVFQWLAERDTASDLCLARVVQRSPFLCETALWLSLIGLGLGALALVNALAGLRARALPQLRHFTLLFPMYDEKKSLEKAKQVIDRLTTGLTEEQILAEYQTQLLALGSILHQKIKLLSRAVLFFQIQVLTFILTLAVAIIGLRF